VSPRFLKTSFALVTGLCLLACQSVPQKDFQRDPNREFDKATGELVMDAQYLAGTGAYEKAMAKLIEARSVPGLIPYEDSTISSMMGSYAYEIDDLPAAIGHFQKAVASGGLINSEVKSTQLNIAQLHIANGDYALGAKKMVDWMEVNGEQARYIKYAMQAYVKAGEYSSALPLAEKWFAHDSSTESPPDDLLVWLKNEVNKEQKEIGSFKIEK